MGGLLGVLLGGAAAGIGFAVGVTGTLTGAQRLRPLSRELLRGYLVLSERAREMTAVVGESMQDLYAEAKAEKEAELKADSGDHQVLTAEPHKQRRNRGAA